MSEPEEPELGDESEEEADSTADSATDSAAESERDAASLLGVFATGAWKLAYGGPRKALHLAHRGVSAAERLALTTLRRRMDAVVADDEAVPQRPHSDHPAPAARAPRVRAAHATQTAVEVMAQLMTDALEQSTESAQALLALRIVRQLVPDEARILAALADGHQAALMHLAAGMRVGPASQRWLENLSPVGREAGVQLPDQTPAYITHLRELGLLESGDEDKTLQLKYQLLEADTRVRKTCDEIEKSGLRPKFFRRTICMSEAGKAFWAACEPMERESW